MLVIPIINVDSFEEAEELIKMVEPYVDPANGGTGWVQIDMMHDVYDLSTTILRPAINCPDFLASKMPFSDKSTSTQPVNLFSAFQML